MELLQLVEKFKNVFSIEKIEDVVNELKSTLLNAENCRKLCEDWILICPDLTIDYMQMIFQYYFADRKEKMQDYTPKSLAVAVAELSKTENEKIVKNDYFKTTKNKNEITFSNNSKENISSILMMIFNTWKQHIYYLNLEENRYLAELRDALLPELMSGKIDISDI